MCDPAGATIPVHPLIAKLTEGDAEPQVLQVKAPVKLSGYIGPASQSGMVRLYSTLSGLSHYVEFPKAAVVHTASTPETVLPDGAMTVWIRKDTPVRLTREYTTASAFTTSVIHMLQRQAFITMHTSRAARATEPIQNPVS
jgi:hypothetical protein